jgi:hypothetical protein
MLISNQAKKRKKERENDKSQSQIAKDKVSLSTSLNKLAVFIKGGRGFIY